MCACVQLCVRMRVCACVSVVCACGSVSVHVSVLGEPQSNLVVLLIFCQLKFFHHLSSCRCTQRAVKYSVLHDLQPRDLGRSRSDRGFRLLTPWSG